MKDFLLGFTLSAILFKIALPKLKDVKYKFKVTMDYLKQYEQLNARDFVINPKTMYRSFKNYYKCRFR